AELGAEFTIDPTITPMMNGDRSILDLNIPRSKLHEVFHDESLVGNVEDFCAPPGPVDDSIMDGLPCSAGHTACYISPYGDVYPCVQFPLPCGNVRQTKFVDIWQNSPQLPPQRAGKRALGAPAEGSPLDQATPRRTVRAVGTPGLSASLKAARRARTSSHAPAVRVSPTWKATCADHRRRTARSRSPAPATNRSISRRRKPSSRCARASRTVSSAFF